MTKHRAVKKKEFCGECGAELKLRPPILIEKWDEWADKFDTATGKRRYVNVLACPHYIKQDDCFLFQKGYLHTAYRFGDYLLI